MKGIIEISIPMSGKKLIYAEEGAVERGAIGPGEQYGKQYGEQYGEQRQATPPPSEGKQHESTETAKDAANN